MDEDEESDIEGIDLMMRHMTSAVDEEHWSGDDENDHGIYP